MPRLLVRLIISVVAILIAAYIVPGVSVDTWLTAVVVAIVLGTLNVLIKPLLVLLTLPVTILTLGLFTLVIDVLLIMLASSLIPGFVVMGFWSGLFFAVLTSLVSSFLGAFAD